MNFGLVEKWRKIERPLSGSTKVLSSTIHPIHAEMQKVADAADISVLFFSAGANFWAILGHFWAILAILGHFWAILGNFRSFLGHFLWQNMPLCYLNRFLQLCLPRRKIP